MSKFPARSPVVKARQVKMSKMKTQSKSVEKTKSVKSTGSEIINNYFDFNLKKMVNAWFRIDARDEKHICENLSAPLIELLCPNYDL